MRNTDTKTGAKWPGRPGLGAFVLCLAVLAALAAACGGGGGKPSEKFFSSSTDTIRRLVPEARAFALKTSAGDDSSTQIDYVIWTALEGNPRVHVVSDEDAVKTGEQVGEYEGFSIYEVKSSFWAELRKDPPLYVSAADRDILEAYVDFYRSGDPEISDQRFWNGLEYARDRMSKAVSESPAGLLIDFRSDETQAFGGMRIEADLGGGRRLYIGVVFGPADGELEDAVVDEFKVRFAVPAEAEEQTAAEWEYPNRIWYADVTAEG